MSKINASLHAQNLGFRVGDFDILKDISFSLHPGELCGLIGPSGAGKSTLIKMLLGLREPTSGKTFMENPHASVGYVPQDDAVHKSLTIEQSLHYAAELWLHEIPQKEREERIETICEQLGIADRKHLRIKSLSGGQRKRVSVALELLHQPQFLVLDEPTSGLDPGLEAQMMRLFSEVTQKGRILMVATHAMQSLSLCDSIMILMRGRLIFFGRPEQAIEYFSVLTFADIFVELTQKPPQEWAKKWQTAPQRRSFAQRSPPPRISQQKASTDQEPSSARARLEELRAKRKQNDV